MIIREFASWSRKTQNLQVLPNLNLGQATSESVLLTSRKTVESAGLWKSCHYSSRSSQWICFQIDISAIQ